jgi:sugar-1,4-lactone oxidase-like protein
MAQNYFFICNTIFLFYLRKSMFQLNKYHFKNWAQNEQCFAENLFQPENENEIIQLLKKCNEEKKRLRTFGTGHSWSPVCLSDNYLMNLDRYNELIDLNKDKNQVTIQSGMKLWQLNEYLYKEGFSLKNLGSVSAQSVAGAVSTATHGSGINYQILASQVDSLKLATLSGEVLHLQKERDAELFRQALVSLGCLGIISEITLNIDERYHLHEQSGLKDFDEVCDNVLQWIHECDHLKLWWFPHDHRIMVYRYNRTREKVRDSKFRQVVFDEVLADIFFKGLIWWGNRKPERRKSINRFICDAFLKDINRIEKNWKVFNVAMPPIHRETEWAFDIQHTPQLLRTYRDMISQNNHYINFVQEIRFVKGDNFALSPCYKRDSIYLGAYHACNADWQPLFQDFENLAKQFNGRPHWGKEFSPDKKYLEEHYPELEKFRDLRNKLDPDNLLQNEFTEAIF